MSTRGRRKGQPRQPHSFFGNSYDRTVTPKQRRRTAHKLRVGFPNSGGKGRATRKRGRR